MHPLLCMFGYHSGRLNVNNEEVRSHVSNNLYLINTYLISPSPPLPPVCGLTTSYVAYCLFKCEIPF